MGATVTALAWVLGLLIGFLVATVLFLRRQVRSLQLRQRELAELMQQQDARIFCIEQEQHWLASRRDEAGESVSG